ncbi:hypothetical protein ILYODFUR_038623 [Ilyodon furcidens]|uniref:Uncharacterized protein n=1 Tax=Ilyodon furcidens TaxID=33524 RepID=A0ABV0VB97_9TELE
MRMGGWVFERPLLNASGSQIKGPVPPSVSCRCQAAAVSLDIHSSSVPTVHSYGKHRSGTTVLFPNLCPGVPGLVLEKKNLVDLYCSTVSRQRYANQSLFCPLFSSSCH